MSEIDWATAPNRTTYVVWNEAKTEGFVTASRALAYEVRKSAATNCYDENGTFSAVAVAFCERWVDDNCVIETL